MTKTLIMVALSGMVALTACTDSENRVAYDGQYFRAKASKVEKQRDVFVVSVKDPAKSIDGARLAAHHEATSYCVANFGSSDIVWQVDPLDEDAQLFVVDNQLIFQGRCPQAQPI